MKYYSNLFIILLFCQCTKTIDIPHRLYKPGEAISEFPDTSYFSKIKTIRADSQYLYFFDSKRADIVVLSKDLKSKVNTICSRGQGPEEIAMPLSFDLSMIHYQFLMEVVLQ